MSLAWPTNYRVVTQGFGTSKIAEEPTEHYQKDAGGYRKCAASLFPGANGYYHDFHRGTDIRAYLGTKLYAAEAGTVVAAEVLPSGSMRLRIQIRSGVTYSYSHCSRFLVKVGDAVKRGQVVALAGGTGGVIPHLHAELRRIENGLQVYYNFYRFTDGQDLAGTWWIRPV